MYSEELPKPHSIESQLLNSNGAKLLFEDIPVPMNVYHQGQYSTELAALANVAIGQIVYPGSDRRPPIKELTDMVERDPIVSRCVAIKALRAVQSFGNYTHPKKEIETFINSNIGTLRKSFKRTLYRIISNVILYGFCIAEYTFTSKARGYQGEWRLANINVLDPQNIIKFVGKKGKIEYIEYDNGDGRMIKIPYAKCLHIINNNGVTFNDKEVYGIGDGIAALNYYKLKKVVLTNLAIATKNNSGGLLHAQVPNVGRTILVDSKMNPLKDSAGKPLEVTKQIALNYQMQDLYKRDYIVTDVDVKIDRIQVQNNEQFWQYVLNYIDESIQKSFSVPVGIFDSGTNGVQNVGLSDNFKSIFDSTIYALTALLKEELINKIVKRLLYFNFPFDWFKTSYGEFTFDVEEDQNTVNSRLSTISSLIASGILDQNDIEVISLIRKNLGLPALREKDKVAKEEDALNAKIQKEVQAQLQTLQLQQQLQMLQMPPQPPQDPNAAGVQEGGATQDGGQYPEGGA